MALFEVPGWSVSTAPVKEDSSRKRKRLNTDTDRITSAGVNIDKLMSKLSHAQPELGSSKPKGSVRKPNQSFQNLSSKKRKQKATNSSEDTSHANSSSSEATPKAKKKVKTLVPNSETPFYDTPSLSRKSSDTSGSLTTLQKTMKDSLDGAKFRLINENLYKSESSKAHRMMQEDPNVFEEYHIGFRHQVLSWPTNPVDHYISKFASYPQSTIIADLGCGDAALAKGLGPKGISVISFDLVSDDKFVVEADICAKIPLPGSEGAEAEKSSGEGQVADVVVCALSLMGTNWIQCLREAWRILKAGGQLHIAEVSSRFVDVEQFADLIGSIGFRLKSKDDSNTHFMLFEFMKIPRLAKPDKEWAKLVSRGSILKPCEYKRR